ncbi:fused MFS/spermidine synthase [Psychrosphaera sp.]|nr:fused MFS/spermidine synthase [Psychrosphaera sp.]
MSNTLKASFVLTIFLSSFLLFSIQPIYAKLILPNLGGGSAVWTACLLFFQTMLLAGYLYSFILSKLKNTSFQAKFHAVIVLIAATLMPVSNDWSNSVFVDVQSPFWDVFKLLFYTIGIPYFVLSTTAPLIQHWLGQTSLKSKAYRLYSVSNIAALLALFSYPFIIEHQLTLNNQTFYWSAVYLFFSATIGLSIYTALKLAPENVSSKPSENAIEALPSFLRMLSWFLLSAAGVVLLIATTSKMTQNIPPIPFLWITPLAVYLVTFILTFHNEKIYARWYWLAAFIVSSVIALLLFYIGTHFSAISQISLYLLTMFIATMVCHGELVKTKPDTKHLTLFYLLLSAGGATGSLFASFFATQFFTQYYEYVIGFMAVYALLPLSIYSHEKSADKLLVNATPKPSNSNVKIALTSVVGFVVFGFFFNFLNSQFNQFNVYESRNFYGSLAVKDLLNISPPERRLVDGYTAHGAQRLPTLNESTLADSSIDLEPLSYYRPDSGIGLTLQVPTQQASRKVGLIGLGVGALAHYGQPNDNYIFYELNPDVALVANNYFDYLKRSRAQIDIRLGDARVMLEQEMNTEGSQQFDMLVVDAFSSDAIPVHLLTKEAINLYQHHLKTDGSMAFHISNSYLNLKPVMRSIAKQLNMTAVYFKAESEDANIHTTEWVVFTNNKKYLAQPTIKSFGSNILMADGPTIDWTDDYSSLLSVLKLN